MFRKTGCCGNNYRHLNLFLENFEVICRQHMEFSGGDYPILAPAEAAVCIFDFNVKNDKSARMSRPPLGQTSNVPVGILRR
jgi:hypothetical protein